MSSDTSRHLVDAQAQAQELALVKRPWWLWGLCVLVPCVGVALFFVAGFASGSWRARDDLQRLGEVPDFALLERSGQQVSKTDLLGKVWIASLIFTRCVDECPLVSSQMARLQDAFVAERDVRLVSITVDPAYDTPEVLTRYAQRFAAQPERWFFLTGDKATIYRLVREGFHLGLRDPREAEQSSVIPDVDRWRGALSQLLTPVSAWAHPGAHPHDQAPQAITHSARLVLVDRQGQIRHYYNSTEQDDLRRVPHDVRHLLREGH